MTTDKYFLFKPPKDSVIPPRKLKFFARPAGFDMVFFVLLMLILVIGLVSLFSASYAYSYYQNRGDSYYYITKQITFALLGVAVMLVVSLVDYHVLHRLAIPIMIGAGLLLIIVLFLPSVQNVHR